METIVNGAHTVTDFLSNALPYVLSFICVILCNKVTKLETAVTKLQKTDKQNKIRENKKEEVAK